jgi:DNA-binding winged helix-turn-helix (wHTH) protein/tetratricopeptide (TPR) repeat protein
MPPTATDLMKGFELGPWTVLPERGLLRQGEVRDRLEPMVMDVLVVLARHQGSVVTRDQLVHEVWNDRFVADEAIVAKIATLRQKLGDDARNPKYIETIPRRGYRLIMPVAPRRAPGAAPSSRLALSIPILAAALVVVAIAVIYWWTKREPPPPSPVDSVAVLPFENLCADEDACEPWVAALREELFVNFGQTPLKVAKGPAWPDDRTAQEFMRILDVGAIVHGTLRVEGNRFVVTVKVILSDGFQAGSDKFDAPTADMNQLGESVTDAVLVALRREPLEKPQTPSRPPNQDRWERYADGVYYLEKRDVASLQRARALFQETIQIDPDYGPAYLRLAVTLLLLSDYSTDHRREIFQQAIDVVNLGAEKDASIRQSADMIHGFVYHQFGEWQKAYTAYESALRSPIVAPTTIHWYSRLLSALGLLDQALDQAIAARSMVPGSQVLNSRLANAYLWKNDMTNARLYFQKANSEGVGAPIHHFGYTLFLIRDHRLEAARASAKHAHELLQADDWWVDPVFDGLVHPDNQELRDIAYETVRRMVDEQVPPYVTMFTWALFGEADEVMNIAMQLVESGTLYEHESAQVEIFYLDEMKLLREHEDFPELISKIGLTDYWESIGCHWSDDRVQCAAN